MRNVNGLTTILPYLSGQSADVSSVLVKYTYNGDATLDGKIDASDYFRIDQGFLAQPANPSYREGDFNYDNLVNADDYFLIDQAFLGQGAPLGGLGPVSTIAAASVVAVPEPATLALFVGLAAIAAARRLRRKTV